MSKIKYNGFRHKVLAKYPKAIYIKPQYFTIVLYLGRHWLMTNTHTS
jgi:hypothetical protein